MKHTYTLPPMAYYPQLLNVVRSGNHVLIAGSTGSGKSVLLNSMIYSELAQTGAINHFMWFDTKRVELLSYKTLPHAWRYCQDLASCKNALAEAVAIMEQRYKHMAKHGLRLYNGPFLFIVIDEMSDLLLNKDKKSFAELISRIAREGRAAKVILIACTQNPSKAVLSAPIASNFPVRIGLQCATPEESRQIIGTTDCLRLRQGECIIKCGLTVRMLTDIPMTSDFEIQQRVDTWRSAMGFWERLKARA